MRARSRFDVGVHPDSWLHWLACRRPPRCVEHAGTVHQTEGRPISDVGCVLCVTSLLKSMNEHVRKAGEGTYNFFRILATPWGPVVAARGAMSRLPGEERGISWHPWAGEMLPRVRRNHPAAPHTQIATKATKACKEPRRRVSGRSVLVSPCDKREVAKDTKLGPQAFF